MKKSFLLIGTAAIAFSAAACSSDSEPTPVTAGDGDGDTGSGGTVVGSGGTVGGDGDVASGGTVGGDGDVGSGGTPVTGTCMATFVTGGLGESGDWSGYLWTAASTAGENGGPAVGSTIMPAEFAGSEVSATGTIGNTYEDWAMVGWNINQPLDPETFEGLDPLDTDVSGAAGVAVTVQDNGGSGLRVQIQNVAGQSWCAPVPAGGSGTVPWADFNTACWDGTGDTFDPSTPIAQVMIQAPSGSDMVPTEFDFCVISMGPG